MGASQYDRARVSRITEAFGKQHDLVATDLAKYALVMRLKLLRGISDEEFQREFFSFYGLNNPRLTLGFRKKYFQIMEDCLENWSFDFEDVLNAVCEECGDVRITYAAKMLNTLNDKYPIWDSNVEEAIKASWVGCLDEANSLYNKGGHFTSALLKWQVLNEIYDEMRKSGEYDEYIKAFDLQFPRYSDVPQNKKVDYILWSYGKCLSAHENEDGGNYETD